MKQNGCRKATQKKVQRTKYKQLIKNSRCYVARLLV